MQTDDADEVKGTQEDRRKHLLAGFTGRPLGNSGCHSEWKFELFLFAAAQFLPTFVNLHSSQMVIAVHCCTVLGERCFRGDEEIFRSILFV